MINRNKKIFLLLFGLIILLSLSVSVYSQICAQKDIEFLTYKTNKNSAAEDVYVVSIDSDYFAKNSDIAVEDSLKTVEKVARENKAKVAINAGFFDPINQKTTSYILKNNKIIANPKDNENLMNNAELKPYLDKILNRSEFRVLSCPTDKILQGGQILSAETRFEIKNHNEPLPPPEACSLVYSVQAGPELAPELKLEDEFFVLKNGNKIIRESAGVLHKYARSAIGIQKDIRGTGKYRILLVAVSNKTPMTIEELADFMKNLRAEDALAFDGGSSTSLFLDNDLTGKEAFVLTSAKDNSARSVKSVLIVK